ncbi:MAG: right-handed parallel beta-helix repeat-containing protein [Phycisphaerae bacterium]
MRRESRIRSTRVLALVGLSLLVPLSGQMCSPGPGPAVCIELSDDIDTATTLSAACYRVTANINVDAPLTINPGVTLEFDAGRWMSVNSGGSLHAVGTTNDPIVFTGREAVSGYWGGLTIYHSNSNNNRLEHVTIEYGGSASGANLTTTGLASEPPRLAVVNCTLRNSAGYGLYLDEDSVITDFSNNTLTGNALGAASVGQNVVGVLDAASTYSGNTRDVVNVYGGSVSSAQTWQAIDADYLFDSIDLVVDADLTISAGATLVFGQARGAWINEDGSLRAVGTSVAPITFTGKETTAGYWKGLEYYHSNSNNNRLEHVTIEYGGGNGAGNLYLTGDAQATAANCTFAHSSTYGVYVGSNATINNDVETANQFSGNAQGAVYIAP